MKLRDKIHATLGFRTLPTTALLVLIYFVVFTSIWFTGWLPEIPENRGGLNIEQTYRDWYHITAHPRPYNSHANLEVRAYILSRLKRLALEYEDIQVADDMATNLTRTSSSGGVYFEGTNILVRVQDGHRGKNTSDGILFSTHYNTPPASPGAAGGLGVATLLQLVEYFSVHRPKHAVIFCFANHGTSDFEGAYAFLKHPWSKVTNTFLTIDAGKSGGLEQPMLTRATSSAPLLPLTGSIRRLHANVLSADILKMQPISSFNEYDVYAEGGMEGLELSILQPHSVRGTKYDAIQYMEDPKRTLWGVMDVVRYIAVAFADGGVFGNGGVSKEAPLYFDLFSAFQVVFPLRILLIINVATLILGPLFLLLLVNITRLSKHQERVRGTASPRDGDAVTVLEPPTVPSKVTRIVNTVWMHTRFWVAIAATIGFQALLVFGFVGLNPFTLYSSPYIVLFSSFTLSLVTMFFILRLPSSLKTTNPVPPERQKQSVLIQTYVLTWILLLVSAVLISQYRVGAVYPFTIWNISVFVACLIGYYEHSILEQLTRKNKERERVVRFQEVLGNLDEGVDVGADSGYDGEEEDQEVIPATERTPLILRSALAGANSRRDERQDTGVIVLWILQLLLVVPVPVLLIGQMVRIVLAMAGQAIGEGNGPVMPYACVSFVGLLLVLPLAPFVPKIHVEVLRIASVACILTTSYLFLAFPFSPETPLKAFLGQRVILHDLLSVFSGSPATHSVHHTWTTLTSIRLYLTELSTYLPSAMTAQLYCSDTRTGLGTCGWEGLMPSPGSLNGGAWVAASVERLNSTNARIALRGRNTRSCKMYFDSQPIYSFKVHAGNGVNTDSSSNQGLRTLSLWSRSSGLFVVEVEWSGKEHLEGRIVCHWEEYESGMVDNGGSWNMSYNHSDRGNVKIPALEEALSFLPKWAALTGGSVEAIVPFSI